MTPQSPMMTSAAVSPLREPTDSIALTTLMPSTTWPKTVCFPSRNGVATVQMKNCDPFVFGPAFAMERIPGPSCLSVKFSSGNVRP